MEPPGRDHFFGTDLQGRDIFSRVLFGLPISLTVVFEVTAAAILIGVPLGAFAGYYGGIFDDIIMRVVEEGPVEEVFQRPRHPYTRLLLESIPSPLAGEAGAGGLKNPSPFETYLSIKENEVGS